jgi:hypothetical protein
MNILNRATIIFTVLIVVISITSCRKAKEEKLVGNWEYQWFSRNDSNDVITWTFTAANKLQIIEDTYVKNDTVVGYYFLEKKKWGPYFVRIYNSNTVYNGTYRLIDLNEEMLIIQKVFESDGSYAYIRYEFIRK